MTDSPSETSNSNNNNTNNVNGVSSIPFEIVSEEEMAIFEAALAFASRSSLSVASSSSSSSSSSSLLHGNARSVESISILSKRRLSGCSQTSPVRDIEDSGPQCRGSPNKKKKGRLTGSLLHRFRRRRGLSVTDITASEWCEKQMEFSLLLGKPESTKAMKAGSIRHAKLEEEVVKKVAISVETLEDIWAQKFMNFIVGVNQLMFEGLTRELPLVGYVEGVWMVGVADEVRMPLTGTVTNPLLVDTKTRAQATLPSEPQCRNGRIQLMCYKHLWDSLAAEKFPSSLFFDFYSLNPHHILLEAIRDSTAKSGFPAKTLDDLVRYFRNTCSMLPPAKEKLLLRYELQDDNSLLGEEEFNFDLVWLKNQIRSSLEFWKGEREATYTPQEERWKCSHCKFASVCPSNTNTNSASPQRQRESTRPPSCSLPASGMVGFTRKV